MAFTWSRLNKGDIPRKDRIDEIVNNMASILNALDKGINWEKSEYAQLYGLYRYDDIVALRSDIDELDAIKCNDCSSYNAFEKSAACPLAKLGYCSTDYTNFFASVLSTEDTGYKTKHFNNELAAHDSNVFNEVRDGHDVSVLNAEDGMDNSALLYSNLSGNDETVCTAVGNCSGDDTSAYSGHNKMDDGAECGFHKSNEYYSDKDNYYESECTGNYVGVDAIYRGTNYETDDMTLNTYDKGTYHTNDYNGFYGSEFSAFDDGYLAGECPSDYVSDYRGHKTSDCNTYYSGEDAQVFSTANSGHNPTYYSGDDNGYDSGENGTNYADKTGHFNNQYTVAGLCTGNDFGYYNTYNSGQDNPHNGTYHSRVNNSN